ncbi:MAG: hypothetical protein WC400_02450 [Patescibacteria group bacterium]
MLGLIKKDLPNFPNEVITDWLEPYANQIGWPPNNARWLGILAGKSLAFWRGVTWKKVRQNLEQILFTPDARQGIEDMYSAYVKGSRGVRYDFRELAEESGKKRFLNIAIYMAQHGEFPKPVAFLKVGEGHQIVDGNHRFLAWYYFKIMQKKFVDMSDSDRRQAFPNLSDRLIDDLLAFPSEQLVWIAEPAIGA